jgi:flagellar hook-basal body complex protein FliE
MAVETVGLKPATLSLTKPPAPAGPATGATGFAEKLESLVESVEEKAAEANVAIGNMVNKTGDVHDAMLALQRAEMTFQITVQVRNKLMNAYNEIMRMPV